MFKHLDAVVSHPISNSQMGCFVVVVYGLCL